jgi:hypothetical protein
MGGVFSTKGDEMKFNNVDMIISRRLPSLIPTNEIVFEDRLTSEGGVSLTVTELPMIIKEFFTQQKVLSYDSFPPQIMTLIREFMTKDNKDIVQADLQNLFSMFDLYDYPSKIIGRLDLDEAQDLPASDQRAYLINNYMFNASMTCGVYSGYAMNYSDDQIPIAGDFIHIFNLNDQQLDDFNLSDSIKVYEIYKNNGSLNKFNDSYFLNFFRARGMKFVIERHD